MIEIGRLRTGLEQSGLSAMGLGHLKAAPGDAKLDPQRRKIKTAAREFEAVLAGQLFSVMRNARLAQDPLDKGAANEIFRSMLDNQLAREMARRGTLGIAETIFKELSRRLPVAPAPQQD